MTAQVDIEPELDFPADPVTPAGDLTCQVCDAPLSWSGKGFRPKYCADHKRGKGQPKVAADKAAPTTAPKATRNSPQVNRAIDSIRMIYALTGTALNRSVAPTIGAEIFNNSEKLAESYRMLLETNKQVRDWFVEVEGKAAWLPILVVHADLALNIALAGQRAQPAQEQDPGPAGWDPFNDFAPPRPDGA